MKSLRVEVTLNGDVCSKVMRLPSDDNRKTYEITAQEIRAYFATLGYDVGQHVRIL